MGKRFVVEAHIPKGSADAEYRVVEPSTLLVVAIVDPAMELEDPEALAEHIADLLNISAGPLT